MRCRRCASKGVRRAYLEAARELGRCCDSCRPDDLPPARSWRWWRLRAPASRRCCTSPACSNGPTAAKSIIGGKPTRELCRTAGEPRLRRDFIGFVYQFHHLLPEFSALENLRLPQMIAGASRADGAPIARRSCSTICGIARAGRPSAGRTVGRRTAARRHRAGRRQRAAPAACRRAHRQSRSGLPPPRCSRRWRTWCANRPVGADCHAQSRTGRPHGPLRHDRAWRCERFAPWLRSLTVGAT